MIDQPGYFWPQIISLIGGDDSMIAIIIAIITVIPATIAAINSITAKKAAHTATVVAQSVAEDANNANDLAQQAVQKADKVSIVTAGQIQELKVSVDGRLQELLDMVKSSSLAQGRVEGIDSERQRVHDESVDRLG